MYLYNIGQLGTNLETNIYIKSLLMSTNKTKNLSLKLKKSWP